MNELTKIKFIRHKYRKQLRGQDKSAIDSMWFSLRFSLLFGSDLINLMLKPKRAKIVWFPIMELLERQLKIINKESC